MTTKRSWGSSVFGAGGATTSPSLDVICLSLEPWDDVWRRNQLLTFELLRLRADMRILFVELPVDVAWSVLHRHLPRNGSLRPSTTVARLWTMAPTKWLPRRIWPAVDRGLARQVVAGARRVGFSSPVLWVNDSSYADFAGRAGVPVLYDITDDWQLGATSDVAASRERVNDERLLDVAAEVVVCSEDLSKSRSRRRPVHLIPNGVDVDHFRRPQARPGDLGAGRTVVYSGTLSDGRLDVDLCVELCSAIAGRATFVLVGPNSLSAASNRRLAAAGARLLGSRPYDELPGYLQHADVLVVPHVLSPFTESLDPIKARELVAVARPTVSTPVAGFRDLGEPIRVRSGKDFTAEVSRLLSEPPVAPGAGPLVERPASWSDRAGAFLALLESISDDQ